MLQRAEGMTSLTDVLSTSVAKAVAAPFHRTKLLLQLQAEHVRQGWLPGPSFSGVADGLSHTVRTEGPLGLLRGSAIDTLLAVSSQVITAALRNPCRALFVGEHQRRLSSADGVSPFRRALGARPLAVPGDLGLTIGGGSSSC